MSDKSVREALEKPFPPEAIKTRPSAHGPLSYVETWRYIETLNRAFIGDWNFRVISHQVLEGEVVVVAELSAGGVVKQDIGAASLTYKRDSDEIVGIGDSYKSAASDALKRCCRLFGLGLSLYSDGDSTSDNGQVKPAAPAIDNGASKTANSGNGSSGPTIGNNHAQPNDGNGDDKSRLSSRQLGMILGLARERGFSREKLNLMIEERFNRRLEFITRSEASWFIQEMQQAA